MKQQITAVARLALEAPRQIERVLADARRRLDRVDEPMMRFALHTQGTERHPLEDVVTDRIDLEHAAAAAARAAYAKLTDPGALSPGQEETARREFAEAIAVFEEPHTSVVIVHGTEHILVYWSWRYAFTVSCRKATRADGSRFSWDVRSPGMVPLPKALQSYSTCIIDTSGTIDNGP